MGSRPSSEVDPTESHDFDDFIENEQADVSDDETLEKTESQTIKELTEQCGDSDQDSLGEDHYIESVNSKFTEMSLLTVKEKSDIYKEAALSLPTVSEETRQVVKKCLSKHDDPVACPICGQFMKNEKGVKLHISKKNK